jgi:sugar/nucleoside kinase (ribokinase family)
MLETPRYIACGGMTVDSVITADGRRLLDVCGGNALYSAVGMRAWDDSVGIVGRVGDDYPTSCLDLAADRGLDIQGLRRLPGTHELRVAFAYRPDGSRTRTVPPDLLAAVPLSERHHFRDTTFDDATYLAYSPQAEDVPEGWLPAARGIHLPALRFTTQRALTQHVRAVSGQVPLTMDSPWYEGSDVPGEDLSIVLRRVSAVLPSEQDTLAVWPDRSPLEAAIAMRELGARAVIIKLGGSGCLVMDRDGSTWRIPAFPADATELTGAGDAFCGGFLVGLAETGDLVRAACYGTVSASFVVETSSALEALSDVDRVRSQSRLDQVLSGVISAGAVA